MEISLFVGNCLDLIEDSLGWCNKAGFLFEAKRFIEIWTKNAKTWIS